MNAPFIRPVPQRFPGTALSGAQTQLLGSLAFPAAGGVQAVDATGAVFDLVSSSGSPIPSADNVDDLGTPSLEWRYGYFGTGVSAPLLGTLNTGVFAPVVRLQNSGTAVNTVALTNSATTVAPIVGVAGNDTNINLNLSGKGTGTANATADNSGTSNTITAFAVSRTVTAGAGANNVGTRIALNAPNTLAAQTAAGFITGILATATSLSEIGNLSLGGTAAGIGVEAVRLMGVAGSVPNRLQITPAAEAGTITLAAAGGTDGSVALVPAGAGVSALRGAGGVNVVAVSTVTAASRLGFYNVTPVARQVLATGTGATVDNVITALQNLGLLSQT